MRASTSNFTPTTEPSLDDGRAGRWTAAFRKGFVVASLVATACTGNAQISPWYLTDYSPNSPGMTHRVQAGTQTATWTWSFAGEIPIYIANAAGRIRQASYVGNGAFPPGEEFTLAGAPTGTLYYFDNNSAGAYDAGFDGKNVYIVDWMSGQVAMYDKNFLNPVNLFTGLQNDLGITYDTTNHTVWTSNWGSGMISEWDPTTGNLMYQFFGGDAYLSALAYDYADDTLWVAAPQNCMGKQFDKAGNLLQTIQLPNGACDVRGGEMPGPGLNLNVGIVNKGPNGLVPQVLPDPCCTGRVWEDVSPPSHCSQPYNVYPRPREGHAMAYDRFSNVVVMFGGDSPQGALDDTWFGTWDPVKSKWNWTLDTGPRPPARSRHAMAPDPNQGGRVVMYGGLDLSASKIYDDMWVYNPVINGVGYGWTQINPVLGTPTPPPPVYAHAMATDDSTGLVVMTCDPSPYNHGETWEWNGVSWNFRNFGGMGSPDYRSDQAMAYHPMNQSLGGGGVMIFGGRPWANGSNPWGWLSSAATWTKLSPLPPPNLDRDGTAMVYDSSCRNKIVVYGGADAGGYANDEIWLWDDAPAGGTWTQVAATPNNPGYRYLHAMAYDELSDRIVMFGGSKSSGQCGGVDNETWVASPCKHDYNRDWVSDGFDDLAFYNDVVNGVKLPLCWDLNGDGVVDVFDVAVFPGLPCY